MLEKADTFRVSWPWPTGGFSEEDVGGRHVVGQARAAAKLRRPRAPSRGQGECPRISWLCSLFLPPFAGQGPSFVMVPVQGFGSIQWATSSSSARM